MKVNVKFFATLRDATGASEGVVEVEGDTIGEIISALATQYGDKFRQEIFQPDGNVKPSVKVLRNESFVDSARLLQSVVEKGDTLSFLPTMFGG